MFRGELTKWQNVELPTVHVYSRCARCGVSWHRLRWVGFKVGMDTFNVSCLFSWSQSTKGSRQMSPHVSYLPQHIKSMHREDDCGPVLPGPSG